MQKLSVILKTTLKIPQTTRQRNIRLVFATLRLNDYTKVIDYLKQVLNPKDKLAQNAYFHLADCFLKTDDKQGALTTLSLHRRWL